MASDCSYRSILHSQLSSSVEEQRWVSLVRRILEQAPNGEDDKVKVQVCVFSVPKNLLCLKPEAFKPQLFAFGPYHHWAPQLYDMERYKLAAARKIQADLHSLTLHDLVTCFLKHEQRIRSYYHKHLDFTGETLAWMMVIDASFLLDFLRNFREETEGFKNSSQHIWDAARIKMAYDMVIRDAFMLENQIPLFLLAKIHRRSRQFSFSSKLACEELSKMVIGFVKEVSPFKAASSNIALVDIEQHHHLLSLLYCMIVPKVERELEIDPSYSVNEIIELNSDDEDASNPGHVKRVFASVWSFASNVNDGAAIQIIKRYAIIGPIKLLAQFPWKIVSRFPGISVLQQAIQSAIYNRSVKLANAADAAAKSNPVSRPPLIEEISIPAVTELTSVGIKFMPTNGDLTTIKFEAQQKPPTIYLPTVSLDVNTEVLLRNLVAYEAMAAPGLMVFSRYTELMNGIIDSEEDVRLLRKQGIILNRMKSDKEVADLWNGMNRSVMLSKVRFMDAMLEDINRYYDGMLKVKSTRLIKKYVFGSWQLLTLLAAIVLLLLTCLQAFCNVYGCGERWFHFRKEG